MRMFLVLGGVMCAVVVVVGASVPAYGIAVEIDPKEYPNGRFARTHDPDGNPIELWEPAGPYASARE